MTVVKLPPSSEAGRCPRVADSLGILLRRLRAVLRLTWHLALRTRLSHGLLLSLLGLGKTLLRLLLGGLLSFLVRLLALLRLAIAERVQLRIQLVQCLSHGRGLGLLKGGQVCLCRGLRSGLLG